MAGGKLKHIFSRMLCRFGFHRPVKKKIYICQPTIRVTICERCGEYLNWRETV